MGSSIFVFFYSYHSNWLLRSWLNNIFNPSKTINFSKMSTSLFLKSILNIDYLKSTFNSLASNPISSSETFVYGTSGFRMHNEKLDIPLFATCLITFLRTLYCGEFIGIMITASHNPPQDNGFKTIEPKGEMLPQSWEKYVTSIANSVKEDQFDTFLNTFFVIASEALKDVDIYNKDIKIIVGRDTRESSYRLVTFCKQFFNSVVKIFQKSVNFIDYGVVTTPQLHFIVRKHTLLKQSNKYDLPKEYFNEFFQPFINILNKSTHSKFKKLYIDCANGVGAVQLNQLKESFKNKTDKLEIELINTDYKDFSKLNVDCGADFVKTNQKLPQGVSPALAMNPENLFCSLDGDADRIIFYALDENSNFCLLDGDRMATLIGEYFIKKTPKNFWEDIKLGIVQTAYANGNSTSYITEELKLDVKCAKTGVKNLHHDAVENFDVGIYFEANGHGTVIFNDLFITKLKQENLTELSLFVNLINQAVGDAITDMFVIVAILIHLDINAKTWFSKYTDLPNRLVKCVVPDRTQFKTFDFERQLSKPEGLQDSINQIVSAPNSSKKTRSFVRASGTEDVVRIYAESSSMESVDAVITEVLKAIEDATT